MANFPWFFGHFEDSFLLSPFLWFFPHIWPYLWNYWSDWTEIFCESSFWPSSGTHQISAFKVKGCRRYWVVQLTWKWYFWRRFSKPPNGSMEYRRTSTMASRRIPSMERGRIHLFSMEDGRIPSFNAFLTKNVISVHFTYGTEISWHSEQLSPLYQHIFMYLVYSSLPGLRKIHTQPKEK